MFIADNSVDIEWRFSRRELTALYLSPPFFSPKRLGLFLDSIRGRAFCTDGARLIVAQSNSYKSSDKIDLVPLDLIRRALKTASLSDTIKIMCKSHDSARIVQVRVGSKRLDGHVIPESPPDIDLVIPKGDARGAVSAFNADYISHVRTIVRACPKTSQGTYPIVHVYPSATNVDPALFRIYGGRTDWTYLVMPVRQDYA